MNARRETIGVMRDANRGAELERVLPTHAPALGRLAASYESRPALREELLQDIAFALWRALPFVPARGLGEDVRDAHRHQPRLVAHRRRPPAADGLDAAGEIADTLPRPDELAARIQTAGRLQQAVRELPLALRQVMVLAFEGLSNEEIAAVLGLTAGNVGVRLHRGKALLKATLGETT